MNAFKSFRIDLSREPDLKSALGRTGFRFFDFDHSFWRAIHGKHGVVTLYRSGKFLIQGKDVEEIASFLTNKGFVLSEPHPIRLGKQGMSRHIGTDESGKGDYFGALVIAGTLVTPETYRELLSIGVKDSKRLSDLTIKKLALQIKALCPHSIITWTPAKYNRTYQTMRYRGKLHRILAWGHAQAIENILAEESCEHVISDQFAPERFIRRALSVRGIHITLEQRSHYQNQIETFWRV